MKSMPAGKFTDCATISNSAAQARFRLGKPKEWWFF